MRKTKLTCARCGSRISHAGYCADVTCPFNDYKQNDAKGWAGHPDRDPNWKDDESKVERK